MQNHSGIGQIFAQCAAGTDGKTRRPPHGLAHFGPVGMVVQPGHGLRIRRGIAKHMPLRIQQRKALFWHIKNSSQTRQPGGVIAKAIQNDSGQRCFAHKAFARRLKLHLFKPGLAVKYGHTN